MPVGHDVVHEAELEGALRGEVLAAEKHLGRDREPQTVGRGAEHLDHLSEAVVAGPAAGDLDPPCGAEE